MNPTIAIPPADAATGTGTSLLIDGARVAGKGAAFAVIDKFRLVPVASVPTAVLLSPRVSPATASSLGRCCRVFSRSTMRSRLRVQSRRSRTV